VRRNARLLIFPDKKHHIKVSFINNLGSWVRSRFIASCLHIGTQTLEAPPSVPSVAAHLHLKVHTRNNAFLLTLKKGQL